MGNYHPAPYPRRPKQSNMLYESIYQIQLAYYRFQLHTAQYIMTPTEKWAYNIIILSFFVTLASAIYYYLPSTLVSGLRRSLYYFTGSHKLDISGFDDATGVIKSLGEAIAVLQTREDLATVKY